VPSTDPNELPEVHEFIAEHSPTRVDEWCARLAGTGVLVVYNHPDMFDDPDCLFHVFKPDGKGGWAVNEESIRKSDDAGLGFKTERGDRAAVVMTPEDGEYSQCNLNMTRSLGDFYHQLYGVTWEPEVITLSLSDALGEADTAVMCTCSDGVWDMWKFEEAMDELLAAPPPRPGDVAETRKHVEDFMDLSRQRGEETFGDSADNLTGVVVYVSKR